MTTYKGYEIREGTMDDYVVNELSSYRHITLTPLDVVLDIGANIGVFTKYALARCGKVVAVEPDPDNFALLSVNALGAVLDNAAITKERQHEVFLYKNKGKNKGLHSTVPTRGRDVIVVEGLSWQGMLAQHAPTKIKIDCEGAEYDWLVPVELNAECKGLIIEYNLSRRNEQEKAQATHSDFLSAGWRCTKPPRFGTKAWATLACYERD